jgi:ABC-type uncharacterized transport system involved in gliding motility auxiliary subunit
MEHKQRVAGLSSLYLVVVAAVLVVVNVLGFYIGGCWKRYDTTKNERFTLSQGSGRLVSEGLKEQLQVTVYVTKGLPALELFVEDLLDLMDEYEQASNGKFKYVVIEPKTDELKQKAKDDGLQPVQFGQGSETGDQATITEGYLGMVMEYGSEKEAVPLSPNQDMGLEFWITNKIREIRDRADESYQHVGVIVKEGVKLDDPLTPPRGGPAPNIKQILQQALPFYKIEDVDLQGGDAEIDPKLRGVIVLQADENWKDKELARIDQFLMRGDRSLLVVAGAVNMKSADAAMKATLDTRGLEKLVEGYGIELKKEVVVDWQAQMRLPVQNQMGQATWLLAPGVLPLQHDDGADEDEQMLDTSFAGFFRLEELAFPYPSTVVPHPEKQPQAKVSVVARSSENSTVETDATVDLKPRVDWKPKGDSGSRPIAVLVEGKLKSVYSGKPPEGVDKIPAESEGEARVLVISSSQFLTNPFARAGNPPPMPPQMQMMGANFGGDRMLQAVAWVYAQQYLTGTILAFKNLLDWMAGDRDLLAVSAKLTREPNLIYADVPKPDVKPEDAEEVVNKKLEDYRLGRKSLQQKVQWSLTFLPPALFAGFGIMRWRRREKNRDRVGLDGPAKAPAKAPPKPAAKPAFDRAKASADKAKAGDDKAKDKDKGSKSKPSITSRAPGKPQK